MKHIQVFEGWKQTEMDFSVKPEVIGELVDKHIAAGSTVEKAAEEINQVLNNDPELKGNNEVKMHLKRFHDHFFSPERKTVDRYNKPLSDKKKGVIAETIAVLDKLLNGEYTKEQIAEWIVNSFADMDPAKLEQLRTK
jgi:hypothetical protein